MADDDIEIERKFLLRGRPPRIDAARSVLIDQGYLPGTRIRERIRRIRSDGIERYVRTVKLGQGMARQEFEEETTREVYEALWSVTAGKRLQKRRYYVPEGSLTWEIDGFTDRDLWLAELELPSEGHVVEIPGWLAPYVVRDVTEEKGYGNYSLAR